MPAAPGLCPHIWRTKSPTALEQFAATLSQSVRPLHDACEPAFPMYTLPLEVFMLLSCVKTHEELRSDLCEFDKTLGNAAFVSHQWLSDRHPDPTGQQLKVLQTALANMLSGQTRITVLPVVEILTGSVAAPTASDLGARPLFIWYDYFSCPQGHMQHRSSAINSIHAYVARSEFFIVLCPALEHQQQRVILSQTTWAARGWCRAERMAHELSCADGRAIVVESATHQILLPKFSSFLYSVGEGHFTLQEDRAAVSSIVVQMVWAKLLYLLSQGDLHSYRFLLSQQSVRMAQLAADPIDLAIPGFVTDSDPTQDPGAFLLARFLHQNGFRGRFDRDEAGWSPLCFAAMDGGPLLVGELLQQRADPNDRTTKSKHEALFPKHMPVLSIATCYKRNEALSLLLAGRADPNGRNALGATALHWACVSDNAEGLRLLCQGGADITLEAFPQMKPLQVACCEGAVAALQELLLQAPNLSLRYCLHFAFLVRGSPDLVAALVKAGADVNEPFQLRLTERPSMWMLFRFALLRRSTSKSRLSLLAYHHSGATPLMFSILCGSFGAAYILLAAGARVKLRNSRGMTCRDLAMQVHAPESLMRALEQGEWEEEDAVYNPMISVRF